ncbi:hypothetical protein QBC47DRAFT_358398 [Echria macrotheca]|uniref:Uncharacterized protein n=1 Tax=Echria macrotheca TaxID=438768 RepID=A0AAJ0F807_9PEZI|nr:hypothetical protein QBC47DRAFT_358398 [Echria macrotheca]
MEPYKSPDNNPPRHRLSCKPLSQLRTAEKKATEPEEKGRIRDQKAQLERKRKMYMKNFIKRSKSDAHHIAPFKEVPKVFPVNSKAYVNDKSKEESEVEVKVVVLVVIVAIVTVIVVVGVG